MFEHYGTTGYKYRMTNGPLIHLMLGNAKYTGKTQCAALLADYFRHQGEIVLSIDVGSQGPGLSAYRTLGAGRIHWPIDLVHGETKELNQIFSFSREVRVVDTCSQDFNVMANFIKEHQLADFPGWMVHFPITPTSLKETRAGLLKLLPTMPLPLVFWLNGFRSNEAMDTVLSVLTMAQSDVTGWVMIPEKHATLSLTKEKNLLLSEIEAGKCGLARAVEAESLRTQIANQLDSILSLDSKS